MTLWSTCKQLIQVTSCAKDAQIQGMAPSTHGLGLTGLINWRVTCTEAVFIVSKGQLQLGAALHLHTALAHYLPAQFLSCHGHIQFWSPFTLFPEHCGDGMYFHTALLDYQDYILTCFASTPVVFWVTRELVCSILVSILFTVCEKEGRMSFYYCVIPLLCLVWLK